VADIKKELSQRDAIDFASEDIGVLFRKMFFPTLLGMVSMVLLNLADGAFIGHGAGTESLAAVNIAVPIFDLMAGIGLMFGIGSSVIASVHLSKENVKAARINATQGLIGSFLLTSILSLLMLTHLAGTCRLFGSNEELIPLASSYLKWIAIAFPFCVLGNVGSFIVRLDGSPKYAMGCTIGAALLNILLDWLFIFPLHKGLEGAAIATSISFSLCAAGILYYLFFRAKTLRLYPLRLTLKSIVLTLRNLWYQMKAGFSAMVSQFSISFMVIIGNIVFIKYLGNDGVAAYAVICYLLPIINMMANAIVMSTQPIMSFAYGINNEKRLRESRRMAFRVGIAIGGILSAVMVFLPEYLTMIFIRPEETAYKICCNGMRYFGIASLLYTVNQVFIGCLQSVERNTFATVYSLLRGFALLTPPFLFLPTLLGIPGIWLAIPTAEGVTLALMLIINRIINDDFRIFHE